MVKEYLSIKKSERCIVKFTCPFGFRKQPIHEIIPLINLVGYNHGLFGKPENKVKKIKESYLVLK